MSRSWPHPNIFGRDMNMQTETPVVETAGERREPENFLGPEGRNTEWYRLFAIPVEGANPHDGNRAIKELFNLELSIAQR